jgi:hypothetical protein
MKLQVVQRRLRAGESRELEAGPRIVYDVESNAASYGTDAVTLEGPAHVLCFELVPVPSPDALLHGPVALADERAYLIRCDRVDFPPGGCAYLHTHQGPGLRVLLHGMIRIETQGTEHTYGPLQAWFETGPDPVFAGADEQQPTAFVRCMVLPGALRGKSSIRYVRDEDADKPKLQTYQVFVDEPLADLTPAP